jgi:flagellar biosynthesis/type III secretory pathway chaperone
MPEKVVEVNINTNPQELKRISDMEERVKQIEYLEIKEQSTRELTQEKNRLMRELQQISDTFFGNINHKLNVQNAWNKADSAATALLQRWKPKGRGGRRTRRKQRKGKQTRRRQSIPK